MPLEKAQVRRMLCATQKEEEAVREHLGSPTSPTPSAPWHLSGEQNSRHSNSTAGRALALHVSVPGLIPDIPQGPRAHQESSLSTARCNPKNTQPKNQTQKKPLLLPCDVQGRPEICPQPRLTLQRWGGQRRDMKSFNMHLASGIRGSKSLYTGCL